MNCILHSVSLVSVAIWNGECTDTLSAPIKKKITRPFKWAQCVCHHQNEPSTSFPFSQNEKKIPHFCGARTSYWKKKTITRRQNWRIWILWNLERTQQKRCRPLGHFLLIGIPTNIPGWPHMQMFLFHSSRLKLVCFTAQKNRKIKTSLSKCSA